MAWRYNLDPYAAYANPFFDEYPQPALEAPRQPVQTRPQEPPPGFAYQTILNSFTLAELNTNARPYLAQIATWLPLELAPHSSPSGGGRRVHWKEAERERERALERGAARDPRFEWNVFPRTVGWEERSEWRAQRAEEQEEEQMGGDQDDPDFEDQIQHEDGPERQVERDNTRNNQDVPQVDVHIDFRTAPVRPPASAAADQRTRTREKPPKKRVKWPRVLHNADTAPVVASRFEYYCQWFERFSEQFAKIEKEDQREEFKPKRHDSEYYPTDYDSDARSLEPQSARSRSKYNPKSDPDYQKPVPQSSYRLPIPKNNAPLIEPRVPRHRQAQPVKSSLLQRTGRRVRDALVSGFGMVVDGLRKGMGAQGRTAEVPRADAVAVERAAVVPPVIPPTRPSVSQNRAPAPAVSAARPPSPDEDEKSDTEERFYTRPASPPSESDEEDVFATLPATSAGVSMRERRTRVPAVTVHTTRSFDVPAPNTLDVPAQEIPDAPVQPDLPEIGTGAARPLTKGNTVFNAAQLDFIPIPSDRPVRNLPATATRTEKRIAEANAKYHQHMAQWEAYLKSLAPVYRGDEGEVYREADVYVDLGDDEPRREGSRRRRRPDDSESDWSADESRGRSPKRKGKQRAMGADADVEQPDEKPHKRFRSPPPENKLPEEDDVDDDDKEDYSNWAKRIQETLKQYDKRYEPEIVDSDDSDAVNPDFEGINLDSDLDLEIDGIEVPELAAAPLFGSGFNRDRVMPKVRRPDHDRERERERKRREDRRKREEDERRGSRWPSGRPGQRMYGGF